MPNWFKVGLYSTVIVVAGIGNGGLLFLVHNYKELHSESNILIGGLAAVDLLLCITAPLNLIDDYIENYALCVTSTGFVLLQILTSCLLLVAIAVERYIGILHPLHYYNWVTRLRVKAVIAVIIVYAILVAFVPLLAGWNGIRYRTHANLTWVGPQGCHMLSTLTASYFGLLTIGHLYPSMILMIIIYLQIFHEVYKQTRKIQAQTSIPQRDGSNATWRRTSGLGRERRGTLVLAMLVIYFIISWLPMSVIYHMAFDWFRIEVLTNFVISPELHNASIALALSNSAVNPYIYGFSHRDARRVLKKHFKKCCCCFEAKNPRRQSMAIYSGSRTGCIPAT